MSLKALAPLEPKVSTNAETATSTEINTSVAPISTNDLLTLIASMQSQLLASQQAQAETSKLLAEAIIKTTEPRETKLTPKQIAEAANEKLFKDNERALEKRKKDNQKAEQTYCEHIAGCSQLGDEKDLRGRTSILWHRNDVSVDIGICTNCQRIFRPDEPDYMAWRRKPSINKLSMAGPRVIMDPVKAQNDSYLHDS